ncbi:mechanosensitive ion channel family protein [Haloarchaeobius amylolyticus]|uniref:mechanosensitive ion channel family protein n=1 Tax=Haloarchaeobius amylolyticus TaxID=1198296 RepID=UPI00227032D5|nr:mechanosensitive ion channel family protein [Haloarchaeobius amylolyticus]
MAELASWDALAREVNSLSTLVDSTLLKLLLTLAAFGVMAGLGYVTNRVQDRMRDEFGDALADVLTILVIAVTFGGAATVVVGLWGSADEVVAAMRGLPINQDDGPRIAISAVVALTVHLVSRVTKRILEEFLASTKALSDHQRQLTYRITQVVLWTIGLIVILGIWSVQLTGLLVGAGFAGIVVGMAARQTLGAVLAGFVLMIARPFEIGDWVEIGDSEGIVTDISIFNTAIQTFDGEYVMIPNDIVSGERVVNRSRKGRLRLEVEVGVDYDSDVEHAVAVAEDALDDCEDILSVPTPQVIVKRFADSAVVLGVRFWIDKPSARRKWRARTEVVTALKSAFEAESIKIPFPQRELSGRAEAGGFQVTGEAVGVESSAEAAADGGGGEGGRNSDGGDS